MAGGAVELVGLTKSYGVVEAVRGISIGIPPGGVLLLTGSIWVRKDVDPADDRGLRGAPLLGA